MNANPPLDLSQVTLVNESRSETLPGDVSIFRSPEAACLHLEAWWVRGSEGTALTATGDRIIFAPTEPVTIQSREPHPDGDRLIRAWLSAIALHISDVHSDQKPIPTAVPELIAYIGFNR